MSVPEPGRSSRAEDARRRLELAESQARHEAIEAQRLIDEFVAEMRRRGVPPVPLRARSFDGRPMRTDRRGWYIRQNHSLAIDEDGGYHSLTLPGGWKERLRGVRLTPIQPTLLIGRGGRDGETGTLQEFLGWVLEGRVDQRD